MKCELIEGNFPYERNTYTGVSDILYQRAKNAGYLIDGIDAITTEKERGRFIHLIRSYGRELCDAIGLSFIETPDNIHDVTSGATPFGDFYYCDMLAGLYKLEDGARILDFGCSSGRIIRNLKTAFPAVNAYGCDPRTTSIEFMKGRVANVNWFVNNQKPPIAKDDVPNLDMVFAISVWSHFSEKRALQWFAEMSHLIVPGGKLIFSTHGLRSAFHFSKILNKMTEEKASERIDALKNNRFHFMRYGKSDLDAHWGMAFIPESWITEKLSSEWLVERLAFGFAQANQDVYVLRRR